MVDVSLTLPGGGRTSLLLYDSLLFRESLHAQRDPVNARRTALQYYVVHIFGKKHPKHCQCRYLYPLPCER